MILNIIQNKALEVDHTVDFIEDGNVFKILFNSNSRSLRLNFLKDLYSRLENLNFFNNLKFKNDRSGSIKIDDLTIVCKPKTNSTIPTKISALSFIEKCSVKESIVYDGKESEFYVFNSGLELKKCICDNLKSLDLTDDVKQNILDLLEYRKPNWKNDSDKKILGIYFAELLVPYFIMNGNFQYFKNLPYSELKTIDCLLIPATNYFPCIDSIIRFKDGSYFPISNKFGDGAAASIFPTIITNTIDSKMSISHLNTLCQCVSDLNIDKKAIARSGTKIVYEYGIRKIFNLSKEQIEDTYSIYNLYKKNESHPLIEKAFIEFEGEVDDVIKQNWPQSLTSFFCREIANRLNSGYQSQKQIKNILNLKKYWQANLDIDSWNKSEPKFDFKLSSETEIKIIGSKAPTNSVVAKQGLINYTLS